MKATSLCIVALFTVCGPHVVIGAKLPDSFQRCKRNDPNLNECLVPAIENAIRDLKPGNPTFQMLPTDPLDISRIEIQEGVGRPVNIKLVLANAKANGLTKANVKKVRADLDKRTLEVDAYLPVSYLEADYDMDGRFLVIPLKGKGKCRLDFTGLTATLKIKGKEKKKGSKSYWDIVKFDIVIHDMEKFQVNFENLFNGDKRLGDNTNKVLNENWKAFWQELKPSFEETFGAVFLQLSNLIFGKVPENDIFLVE